MRRHCLALTLILVLAAGLPAIADVKSPSALSSVGCQARETELGNLVADAVKAEAGTPMALVPAGGFREVTIPKGRVKTEDVLKSLQYPDDRVAVIELTGRQLVAALERSVSIYPQKNLGFLQVSGVEFKFDPKLPKGSRLTSVTVGGEKAANERRYRVGATKPLADGAYGYFTIWGKDRKPEIKDKTIAQAVTKFLSARSSVDYQKPNRILIKEK
ncbi:MAG TPA: 5'-nucleotidase [Armatimonadota bacterium]|nr:5'-nucleotidase [Armatimonadota bacterium]